MEIKSYRDLTVWQKAMDLAVMVYGLCKRLPKEEIYALSDQMRRASVSIPSNIAEGHARKSSREYLQFVSVALGSNAELQTQITLCRRLGYISSETENKIMELSAEINRMLHAIKANLSQKVDTSPLTPHPLSLIP